MNFVAAGATAPAVRPNPQRADRIFYTGMAAAMLLTVFVGFSRSYYLKGYFGAPELPFLRHVHGALFTLWILFFALQPALVAARRLDLHRRWGVAGGVLAGLMVPVGLVTAIDAAARGAAPAGIPPLAFLAVPFFDMLMFAPLVGLALWYRNRKETHKRLMLLATISLLPAAFARFPGVLPLGPLAFFGLADQFIVAGAAYDFASRRRVHPAYMFGGLAIIVSQPLRLMISGTPAWQAFAEMLAR